MTTVQARNQTPAVSGVGLQPIQQTGILARPKSDQKLDSSLSPRPVQKPNYRRPYTLHTMERRQYAKDCRARRNLVRVKYCPPRCESKSNITVDSSKARGNLDVLRLSLKELGWREYPYGRKDENCDIYWLGWSFSELHSDVLSGRVNKFPGMIDVLKKANLTRALNLMKKLYPEEYNFYPQTWFMPQQLNEFAADVRTMQNRNSKSKVTFIAKPDDGSQGEGIYLFRDPDEYMLSHRNMVIQEYIAKPFLLDKLKFDLRVYAILTNIDPLEIHICKEGLVRFCTIAYSEPTYKNMHEAYMHLTNYSLNKRSSTYVHTDNSSDGSKRTLTSVLTELGRLGHNVDRVFDGIERVIVKTLIAVLPELRVEMNAEMQRRKATDVKCFQVLGFDILLLENLKPILLEVNANPSLRIDYEHEVSPGVTEYYNSAVDEEIKQPLIRDTLLVVAPRNVNRRFRKIQRWRKARLNRLYSTVPPATVSREATMIEITHEEMDAEKENIKMDENTANVINEEEEEEEETVEEITDPKILREMERAEKKRQKELEKAEKKRLRELEKAEKKRLKELAIAEKKRQKELEKLAKQKGNVETVEGESEKGDNEKSTDENKDATDKNADKNEEDDDSCLQQIFPAKYSEYEEMRIYDRVANIFLLSVGVRGSLRMGGSGFRVFTRRCKLTHTGFSSADMDLIFTEMSRKWEHCNPDRTAVLKHKVGIQAISLEKSAGLCFLGFIEALFHISRRKFYCQDRITMLNNLLDYCEQSIQEHQQESAGGFPKVGKLPQISEEKRLDRMKKIYVPGKSGVKRGELVYDFRSNKYNS